MLVPPSDVQPGPPESLLSELPWAQAFQAFR